MDGDGDTFEENTINPDRVNFYQHYYVWTELPEDCWWGTEQEPGDPNTGFNRQTGRTHLHVWIAMNSHASYNRFMDVYSVHVAFFEDYYDRVAYHQNYLAGPYWEYNELTKMGERVEHPLQNVERHHQNQTDCVYNWHYDPRGNSKVWLTTSNLLWGDNWFQCHLFMGDNPDTPSPPSPSFRHTGNIDSWHTFWDCLTDWREGPRIGGGITRAEHVAFIPAEGNPIAITENTTWSLESQLLYQNCIITNGATLTLNRPNETIDISEPYRDDPRQIIIYDGALVVAPNTEVDFTNVRVVFLDDENDDNTSRLRNCTFNNPRIWRFAVIVNRTLTNPIEDCTFRECEYGIGAFPGGLSDNVDVQIEDCVFEGGDDSYCGVYFENTWDGTILSSCTFTGYVKPIIVCNSAPVISGNRLIYKGDGDYSRQHVRGITYFNSSGYFYHNRIEGFDLGIYLINLSCPRIVGNWVDNNNNNRPSTLLYSSFSSPDISNHACNYLAGDDQQSNVISIKTNSAERPLLYNGCNTIGGFDSYRDWHPREIYPNNWNRRVSILSWVPTAYRRPGVLDQDDYRNNYWIGNWDDNPDNHNDLNPNFEVAERDEDDNPIMLYPGMIHTWIGGLTAARVYETHHDLFTIEPHLNQTYPPPNNGWLDDQTPVRENWPADNNPDQLYISFKDAIDDMLAGNYFDAYDVFDDLQETCDGVSRYNIKMACLYRMFWCCELGRLNVRRLRETCVSIGQNHPDEHTNFVAKALVAKIDESEGDYGDAVSYYENVINDENSTLSDSIYAVINAGWVYITIARQIELGELDNPVDEDMLTRLDRTSQLGSISTLKPQTVSSHLQKCEDLEYTLNSPTPIEEDQYFINSSEIWYGEILLENDVIIENGGLLTIQPGTQIRGNDHKLIVNGELIASGTEYNVISFSNAVSSHNKDDYTTRGVGIILNNGSSVNSQIEYCVFRGSRVGIDIDLDLSNNISHCQFIDCDTAITSDNSQYVSINIDNCYFENKNLFTFMRSKSEYSDLGVYLMYFAPSSVRECKFNGPMQPIVAQYGDIVIDDCYFDNPDAFEPDDEFYAIELQYCNGEITHSTIDQFPSGILLYDSDPLMYANKIENCFQEAIWMVNDSYPDLTYLGTGGNNWLKYNGSKNEEPAQIRIKGSMYPYIDSGHNNLWKADDNGYAISSSVPVVGPVFLKYNYWGTDQPIMADLFSYYSVNDFMVDPYDTEEQVPFEGYLTQSNDDNPFMQSHIYISRGEYADAIELLLDLVIHDTILTNRVGGLSLLFDCFVRNGDDLDAFVSFVEELADTTVFERISRKALHVKAQMQIELSEYEQAIEYYESIIVDQGTSLEDSICAVIDAGNVYLRSLVNPQRNQRDGSTNLLFRQFGNISSLIPESYPKQQKKVHYLLGLLRSSAKPRVPSEEIHYPSTFRVYQNYPNPFNSYTSLKIDLDVDTYVKIILYDLLGRKVIEVLNSPMKAGFYQTRIDMSKFTSGIYFYIVETNKHCVVKKMVMMK
ncbi:MAG: T9SS type A sorting domain-containing protein [Candidatus Hatepunaea meridiana]|nr:T9SS type A sorting domain-containing protein [Candidatus Hatepunaea meridiana]